MATDLGWVGNPGSDTWNALRENSIGGSDIAAICGWSPYADREKVMQRKLNPQVKASTKSQDRGHRLEDAVLWWLKDRLEAEFIDWSAENLLEQHTYRHDVHQWATCTPDALALVRPSKSKPPEKAIFEAKTTMDRNTDNGWGRGGSGKVPIGYATQVTWTMGIMGYSTAYLGLLAGAVNGRPELSFMHFKIDFNQGAFDHLIDKATEFMDELNERKQLLWD